MSPFPDGFTKKSIIPPVFMHRMSFTNHFCQLLKI